MPSTPSKYCARVRSGRGFGRMGVAACFILLSFYSVVGGWVLNYVVHSFTGEIHVGADFKALFENTISSPFGSLFYQGLFMLDYFGWSKAAFQTALKKANRDVDAGFVYPLYRAGCPFADLARRNGGRGILVETGLVVF